MQSQTDCKLNKIGVKFPEKKTKVPCLPDDVWHRYGIHLQFKKNTVLLLYVTNSKKALRVICGFIDFFCIIKKNQNLNSAE